MHVDSDKQIHMDMDTIVSYVIQSGQVLEGGVISVSHHVNYHNSGSRFINYYRLTHCTLVWNTALPLVSYHT